MLKLNDNQKRAIGKRLSNASENLAIGAIVIAIIKESIPFVLLAIFLIVCSYAYVFIAGDDND